MDKTGDENNCDSGWFFSTLQRIKINKSEKKV